MIVPNYLSADEMRLKTAKTTRRERRGTNGKMIKRGTLAAFIVVVLAAGCWLLRIHGAGRQNPDFTPSDYRAQGKPQVIAVTVDDLGYGQMGVVSQIDAA